MLALLLVIGKLVLQPSDKIGQDVHDFVEWDVLALLTEIITLSGSLCLLFTSSIYSFGKFYQEIFDEDFP
jgi:hypothetical protein